MRLTKLEHSGLIFEKEGTKVLCDVVEIETTLPNLDNVAAVLITHKHGDHLQPDVLQTIRERNPGLRVFAPQDALELVGEAEVVAAGDEIEVGGFKLRFFGEEHAPIIPGEIPCQNVGAVVDEVYVNPGDSYDLLDGVTPQVLFVASAAPWCRVSEAMEYIKAMRPKMVVPVHNAVLSNFGNSVYNNWLRQATEAVGAEFAPLTIGESIEF